MSNRTPAAAARTSEAPQSEQPGPAALPEAVAVLLVIGGLYALGFVVANVHFAQYGIARLDLLRGRYLGASLLFLVFAGWPAALGAALCRHFEERGAGSASFYGRGWIGWALLLVLGVVLMPLFWLWVYNGATVGGIGSGWSPLSFWLTCAIMGAVHVGLSERSGPAMRMSTNRARLASTSIGLAALVLLLAASFGKQMYPAISPAFAGGGAWEGIVVLDTGKLQLSGVVVDRSENFVTMLSCNPATQAAGALVQRMEVPVSRVHSIFLARTVVIPRYLDGPTCRPPVGQRTTEKQGQTGPGSVGTSRR